MHVVQVNLDADCSLAKTHKEIAADDVLLPHLGGEVGEEICREVEGRVLLLVKQLEAKRMSSCEGGGKGGAAMVKGCS